VEQNSNGKHTKLFIVRGVPEDFPFAPRVRKEISEIKWFDLSELPVPNNSGQAPQVKKFWGVVNFTRDLFKWVKKKTGKRPISNARGGRGGNSPARQRSPARDPRAGNNSPAKAPPLGKATVGNQGPFRLDADAIFRSMQPFLIC
jgi:hypothetical protein